MSPALTAEDGRTDREGRVFGVITVDTNAYLRGAWGRRRWRLRVAIALLCLASRVAGFAVEVK